MKVLKTLVAVGALCALVVQVNAAGLNGEIYMNGKATLDNTDLGAATQVTAFSNVQVGTATPTGSFSVIPVGTAVAYSPFKWTVPQNWVNPLWLVNFGGNWTFSLDTLNVDFQNSTFLNLSGTGRLNAPGYDETFGVWAFSINNTQVNNFEFNFISTTSARTPDGGMTMALLGFALMGVEGLRRRFAK